MPDEASDKKKKMSAAEYLLKRGWTINEVKDTATDKIGQVLTLEHAVSIQLAADEMEERAAWRLFMATSLKIVFDAVGHNEAHGYKIEVNAPKRAGEFADEAFLQYRERFHIDVE
jgi:hypothetical protein